jgi:hypothetical protein
MVSSVGGGDHVFIVRGPAQVAGATYALNVASALVHHH